MAEPITAADLGSALDLIGRPLMLEALAAVADGRTLRDAVPSGVDAGLFIDELKALRALRMVDSTDGSPLGRHTLTADGQALTNLLGNLAAAITCTATGNYSPV
ncbi:hypothetical protein OHA72_22450 [Dactylosporangium sp. NBC_01737]|uniref:hypothetical protein n=1 Tax=Dactylosporangium sp. NBC_01737 TaxID=2975959 RepID=UPI002E1544B7|nr:hypothetical protein OHA72_22450 [Dactylosporangium sp. NBC_01737]